MAYQSNDLAVKRVKLRVVVDADADVKKNVNVDSKSQKQKVQLDHIDHIVHQAHQNHPARSVLLAQVHRVPTKEYTFLRISLFLFSNSEQFYG